MHPYIETTELDELKAFIAQRTTEEQVIENVGNFAVVVCQGAIASSSSFTPEQVDQIKITHQLLSGSFIDRNHASQRLPGYRYVVKVTMPDGELFDGHCYLLQGGGGKIINFLLEDDAVDWWQD